MIRVVLDTNVVVSAALIDEGLPSAIFDLATNRHLPMLVSPDILAEYEKVLHYPRLKLDPARIKGFSLRYPQGGRDRHAGPYVEDLPRRSRQSLL